MANGAKTLGKDPHSYQVFVRIEKGVSIVTHYRHGLQSTASWSKWIRNPGPRDFAQFKAAVDRLNPSPGGEAA